VLDLFMADPRLSTVLGNHDRAVMRALGGEEVALKPAQQQCLAELEDGRERYAGFLARLPLTLDLGSHLVVHAGLRPAVALGERRSRT
jgi:hypothetical protein